MVSQPFRLRAETAAGRREHIPDFLAFTRDGVLLAAAGAGPLGFDDLAGATSCPAVARAHALHLIWHRRLGIDLAVPLTGRSGVWLACGEDA